jgi:hypothetical protein
MVLWDFGGLGGDLGDIEAVVSPFKASSEGISGYLSRKSEELSLFHYFVLYFSILDLY